ncbi:hypothetical protein ES703_113818 [subsurface metagenome]
MRDLFGPDLGYFPVLAEFAVHVTTSRGYGEGTASREVVEEGLFFNRIDVSRTGFSVDQGVVGASDVFSDAAVASLFITQFAETGAELAFDLPVRVFFIVPGLHGGKISLPTERVEIHQSR